MKIMLIDDKKNNPETKKIIEVIGKNNVGLFENIENYKDTDFDYLEECQKNYKKIYSLSPQSLLKFKVRIPYYYNIFGTYPNYACFSQYYSQLQGASGVFVSDKKLNKFSEWLGLNSLWVNPAITVNDYPYTSRKFLTPKLNIGFIQKENPSNIIKNMWYAKKSNWNLHIFGNHKDIEDASYYSDFSSFYSNIQVFIDMQESPTSEALVAMSLGIAVLAYNQSKSFDCILFDKVHYFEIDFLHSNTILEILRYSDKRREKLERLGKSGSYLIQKYFNNTETVNQKLKFMQVMV